MPRAQKLLKTGTSSPATQKKQVEKMDGWLDYVKHCEIDSTFAVLSAMPQSKAT